MTLTDEVRAFNRFYTLKLGLLNRSLPATDLSLPEARVLYELAHAPEAGATAADMGRALNMDKAHLSRVAARLRARGLIASRISPDHRRRRLLTLTDKGREAFAAADAAARAQVEALVEPVDARARKRLGEAMRDIRAVLDGRKAEPGEVSLRPPRIGDMGWITYRQAVLYHQEYGWDWTYEGLASRILGAFVAEFDSAREDSWVAERGGAIVGSVFLMKGDKPEVAKLRLLYVEPAARGLGLGRRLVAACIARARELGYHELTLWTNDVLVSARRIYQAAGFRLVSEAPHHSFGHDLVGQTWTLELA
ncbi:MAG TPA: bifunctional helix-turn-helix transcriptional regulator/GNAT family N-acetyltransferase [Roseiarcus sp.]|nr:bifunctional helix-turn-helix transcriptional regulator/GNAT family N-acetyltransferase [Roseiarcus sp.]